MTNEKKWITSEEFTTTKEKRINTYALSADGKGVVSWNCPDGFVYKFDPNDAKENEWFMVFDTKGIPVIAYRYSGKSDGELVVSLEGANSIAATLLHNEDDVPRKYYYATDGKNNTELKRPAFILKAEGISRCPVQKCCGLKIMTVRN